MERRADLPYGEATPNEPRASAWPETSPVEAMESHGEAASTSSTAQRARTGLEEVSRQAREQTQQVAENIKEHGREFVGQQRDRLADRVSHYRDSIYGVADKLREEEDTTLAGYIDSLASQLDKMTHYLRQRDAKGMLDDAQHIARRRPEVFFGGLFLAGLTLARFLKASGRSGQNRWHGMGSDEDASGASVTSTFDEEARQPVERGDFPGTPVQDEAAPLAAPSSPGSIPM